MARRWGTHDPLVMEDNAVDQFMLDAYVNRDLGNVVKKQYLQPEHKDTEALAVGPPGQPAVWRHARHHGDCHGGHLGPREPALPKWKI